MFTTRALFEVPSRKNSGPLPPLSALAALVPSCVNAAHAFGTQIASTTPLNLASALAFDTAVDGGEVCPPGDRGRGPDFMRAGLPGPPHQMIPPAAHGGMPPPPPFQQQQGMPHREGGQQRAQGGRGSVPGRGGRGDPGWRCRHLPPE